MSYKHRLLTPLVSLLIWAGLLVPGFGQDTLRIKRIQNGILLQKSAIRDRNVYPSGEEGDKAFLRDLNKNLVQVIDRTVSTPPTSSNSTYSYRGDSFDYVPLSASSQDDKFPVFETDKIRVTLALRDQTPASNLPGLGGAIYQIYNKQHNSTHTLVFNANRYNGDGGNTPVDRSGPPNRIFTGQGISECLYTGPVPLFTNQSDGAAGSSYLVNNEVPSGYDPYLGFNPNEVGDDWLFSGKLLGFGRTSNKFNTTTRPAIYGQNGYFVGNQVLFKKWGEVVDRALKLNYESTFVRTYNGRIFSKGQETPAVYVNGLNIFRFYDGNSPYTNDGVTTIVAPFSPNNQNNTFFNGQRPNGLFLSEPWIWVGGSDGYGICLLLKDNIRFNYGFWGDGGFDPANPSMGGSYGYIAGGPTEIIDHLMTWRHRCEIIVGTYQECRAYVYSNSYRPDRVPRFKFNTPGREGWSLNSGDGNDRHTWDDPANGVARDGWKVYFGASAHATLQSPGGCWEASQFKKVYIRYKYSGNQNQWLFKFQRNRQKGDGTVDTNPSTNRFAGDDVIRYANGTSDNDGQKILFSVIPDNAWHIAEVDLTNVSAWQGVINQFSLKPHAYNDGRSYNSGEYAVIDWIATSPSGPTF